MIKKSTYIRSFTDKQKEMLETLQSETKIKTVPELLFYALYVYYEQKKDIERLKRIIDIKQKKIEKLKDGN